MTLYEVLGIAPQKKPDDRIRTMLLDTAEQMLRGMCPFQPSDWKAMSPAERACLITAGNRIRRENAVLTGISAHSPAHAAEVNVPLDGGEAATRCAMDEVSDEVVRAFDE